VPATAKKTNRQKLYDFVIEQEEHEKNTSEYCCLAHRSLSYRSIIEGSQCIQSHATPVHGTGLHQVSAFFVAVTAAYKKERDSLIRV
jgi:hypothetical protein